MFFLHFGIYMAFNPILLISYHQARQFTNIPAAPVSATVNVANVHSALMHAKLIFPDKRSTCKFNEPGFFYKNIESLLKNVGLMQICKPLSPSLEIFCPVMTKIKYMYNHARVHH